MTTKTTAHSTPDSDSTPSQVDSSIESSSVPPSQGDPTRANIHGASPGGKGWLNPRWTAIMVLLGALLFLVPGTGSYGLFDPWETHYGEVGRNMYESGDWISPWWGAYWPEGPVCMTDGDCGPDYICTPTRHRFLPRAATCRPRTVNREGTYFFSKPALSKWMMALGMTIFGLNELGVRIFFVLSGVLAIFSVFLAVRRFFGRQAGVISSLVLATSPFFFLQARQAVTDTPYVNLATAGICFFLLAAFGSKEENQRRSPIAFASFITIFLLVVIPQILNTFLNLGVTMRVGNWMVPVGPLHGTLYALAVLIFLVSLRRPQAREVGKLYLYAFYLCIGLAALAKGILGFALPGAIILLYLIISGEWALLKRVQIPRGSLVFIAVAVPWYASMLARHDFAFYNRFFIHDHFKRLTSGVHQIDSGQFDHFILWLGLGLFPWVGFVPAAFGRALHSFRRGIRTSADRVRLFACLWFVLAFALFTLSSTKFHHYIFPALPAAAILIGLFISDLLDGKVAMRRLVITGSLLMSALVGYNLIDNPQRLVNLFTYKYDRTWPPYADFHLPLTILVMGTLLPMAAWLLTNRRALMRKIFAVSGVMAVLFGMWTLNGYLGTLSHSWSQRGMFEAYHQHCTPREPHTTNQQGRTLCQEDLISYKMNWRGETFYSENTIIPILNDNAWDYFIKSNGNRPFYALVEYRRLARQMRPQLPPERRDRIVRIHDRNAKFLLVRVEPSGGEVTSTGTAD